MTVNEAITKLQQMIADGEITGSEPFGLFEFTVDNRYVYSEAESIGLEVDWKEFGNNVVYSI